MPERLRLLDTVTVSAPDDPAEPILLVHGSEMVRIRAAGHEVRTALSRLRDGADADVVTSGGRVASALVSRLDGLGWLTSEERHVPGHASWERQVGWWYTVTPDGRAAQRRLSASTIAVLGMGGIGAPVAQHLAAGGVGDLWLLDHDTVATHNLNRQYLYRRSDVGRPKVEAAAEALADGVTRVHPVRMKVIEARDLDMLVRPDLLVVAADHPADLMARVWEWAAPRGVPVLGGGVGLSTGAWGPLLVPAEGDCWPCFERERLAVLGDEQRRLEREGTPTPHSFGPTNGLVADYLARDAMLFLVLGRCESRGRRRVVDVLGLADARLAPDPRRLTTAPCRHGNDGGVW